MALDPFTRDRIARAASGMLGYYAQVGQMPDGGRVTLPAIAQRISDRYGITDNSDRALVLATVRQQRDIHTAGDALNAPNPQNTPNRPTITDWALVPHNEPYGWRVEVTTVNDATGDRTTRTVVITSGAPLTPAEIQRQATDYARRDPTIGGMYPQLGGITDDLRITTRIVTAGKNPL